MRDWHRIDRTAAAFLVVLGLAELRPALPHRPPPVPAWWLGGVAVTVIAAVVWVLVRKQVLGQPVEYVSLLLFFVAVQMLRAADGNASAGFSPVLILAVVWCALYGNRASVYVAVVGVAAVQFGPLILVGEPQYPARLWRAGVLWALILALVGLAVRRLVTALRNKSAALEASEARFRTAFDDAPAGVALVGASGTQHGIYLDVNPALCALLGRTTEELVGHSVLDFTHSNDRGLTERELLSPPNTPFPKQLEKRYVHSSGRDMLASLTYSRIESGPGGEPCFVVHVQDATVQRNADLHILSGLEEEKPVSEPAPSREQTPAAVDTVIRQIRDPLADITAAVRRLTTTGELSVQQKDLVRVIGRCAGQLRAVATDFTTRGQTEDALVPEASDAFDLEPVVRGAIESIRPIAQGRAQALQIEVNLDGAQVTGNADEIRRVVMNVLDNAVKFTPTGGAIDAQARIRGNTVEIEVTDTGIGIDSDEVDRIFDRFYRARSATTRAIPGSGLGLSIAKAIAEQHHGTIQVFSEPDEGSSFTLTLPLRTRSALTPSGSSRTRLDPSAPPPATHGPSH